MTLESAQLPTEPCLENSGATVVTPEPQEVAPEAAPAEVADPKADNPARGPIPKPAGVGRQVIWGYAIMILLFHLTLPLAFDPWFFSWTGVILVPLGNYIFCSIGIGLCFHRTLTHRGLSMPKWLEHFFAVLGVCSLQDSPARWVAVHRMHHQYSDEQPDPHSPLAGFLWGHMEWLFIENRALSTLEFYDRYARDILRDPFYLAFERNLLWFWTYVAHAALFFLAGFGIGWWQTGEPMGGVQFGSSLLLWGVIFRTIYTWHVTWAVNSVAHVWGYRNYRTTDSSRNHWLVALATNGEGWHNNHHADQRSAAHGHRWWELDVTWLTILFLERVGLVWDVVRPRVLAKEA